MRHVQDVHEACLYTMTSSGQCLLRIAWLLLLHASSSCMGCGHGTDLSMHDCHAALPTCRPDGHTILTGLQATLTPGLKYANIIMTMNNNNNNSSNNSNNNNTVHLQVQTSTTVLACLEANHVLDALSSCSSIDNQSVNGAVKLPMARAIAVTANVR